MLITPSVVPPLTPWTRKVRVRNHRSGAAIIVFADGEEVGRGQLDRPDGFVALSVGRTLEAGQRVTARQEFGGETSGPAPATSAELVLQAPDASSLGTIFSRAPMYECSRCLWLEGIVPGAQVEADVGAVQTVSADWTGMHVDVPALGSTQVRARQGNGTVQGPWITLPAPLLQKDPNGTGRQFVHAPSVDGPLYACARVIPLREVMPGAKITLTLSDRTGGHAHSSSFCFGAIRGTFWVPSPLEFGQRVEVRQDYRDCLPPSGTALSEVNEWVPAPPWFTHPVCVSDREVEIGGLERGAAVQFILGETSTDEGEAGDPPHRFILHPLGNLRRIGVRQALCAAGPWSETAWTDLVPFGTVDRPRIVSPIHACGVAVGVEGASAGTTVRVVSQKWKGPIGRATGNGDRRIDVDLDFPLALGDVLHLEVVQCGLFTSLDAPTTVEPAPPDLIQPALSDPLDDAGGCVWVEKVVPGAIVDLEAVAGDQSYAGTPIASGVVTHSSASIDVPPLTPGTRVRARQRLCGRSSSVSLPVVSGNRPPVYESGSTDRIAQLTGWRGHAGRPPRVNTEPIGLVGTDLGVPVEHNGRLYLFFGDCDPRPWVVEEEGEDTNKDADPIAWTTDSPEAPGGPELHWLPGDGGLFHRLHVDGFEPLGNFEVPTGAFSYRGRLYVFVGRDTHPPASGQAFCLEPDRYRMHTSQLAVTKAPANDPQHTLEFLYQVASTKGPFTGAGHWLVNVSPTVVRNADWPGLPSSSGDGLVMFGTACYQGSNVHLAWAPLGGQGQPDVPPPSTWYYFDQGIAATSEDPANWRRADRLNGAIPSGLLFQELPNPAVRETLGELSVLYSPRLRRWVMSYMHAGTTFIRLARTPFEWPKEEIAIFNGRDAGMEADNLPGPKWVGLQQQRGEQRPTVAYAPFLIGRWLRFDRSTRRLRVHYTLSTELPPYNTQLMRSDLMLR